MRSSERFAASSMLVVVLFLAYTVYVAEGVPFIQDPEGMAVVALLLGVPAAFLGGWLTHPSHGVGRAATVGAALLATELGIAAIVTIDVLTTSAREALVAICVTLMFGLYLMHLPPALATTRRHH